MKQITLQQYVHAIERVKVLLEVVSNKTPYNSPEMIELLEKAKIVESYEDVYVKLPEPTVLDRVQFYFEQRFRFGQSQLKTEKEIKELLFDEESLNLELSEKEELVVLERLFFIKHVDYFLPKLANSRREDIQLHINDIRAKKKAFVDSHMAYKGFIGTIEYSEEDNLYFGKLIDINDLVLYDSEIKSQLRSAFKEAVDHHIKTSD